MDKNTLSNYGWIVIAVLVLSVMIALATPFGAFIEQGVRATTEGLFDTSKNAVNSSFADLGVQIDDQEFESGYKTPNNEITQNNIIPEGGIYEKVDGTTLSANDEFPESPELGDKYTYGNYEYRYKQIYFLTAGTSLTWLTPNDAQGWGVRCVNDVENPGEMMETICGQPITGCYRTFSYLKKLKIAPSIPSTVSDMDEMFDNCSALEDISKVVIPGNVESLEKTFNQCTSLEDASSLIIPSNIKKLEQTFRFCQSLKKTPDFANATGLESMYGTFWVCESLQTPPDISNCTSLTDMSYAFSNCKALTGSLMIPCTLIDKDYKYQDCNATIGYYHIDGCDGSCGA